MVVRFRSGCANGHLLRVALSPRRQRRRIPSPALQFFRPRRIQMDVITHRFQIPRAASVHDQRFVVSAEQVSHELVPPVEPAGVGAQKPFHPGHQVRLRRLHHQMKMIGHQTQRLHLPTRLDAHENCLPTISPVQDMIDRPLVFHSQPPRHHARFAETLLSVSIDGTDPFIRSR